MKVLYFVLCTFRYIFHLDVLGSTPNSKLMVQNGFQYLLTIFWVEFYQSEGKIWSVIDETYILREGDSFVSLDDNFRESYSILIVYGGWYVEVMEAGRPRTGLSDASTGDGGERRYSTSDPHQQNISVSVSCLYARYCLSSVSRLTWQGYYLPLQIINVKCLSQMNMFRRNGPASLSHSFSMFQPGSLVAPSPDPGPGSSASLNTHKPPLFTSSCNSISEEDKESWNWHWTVTGCHLGT